MKKMSLFLVGVVLLLGFVVAGVNDSNSSFENDSVVSNETNASIVLLAEDDLVSFNETNETVLLNETPLDENQTGQGDDDIVLLDDSVVDEEVAGDLDVEDLVVEDRESPLDAIVSYVSGVVDRVNAIHQNLFWVILIVLWVLSLFVHSTFFDYSSAEACFSKASSLHRKAQQAHVNGNYAKAKKLYIKSYSFREKGEKRLELER